jgi:hypothetical protein
MQRRVLEDAMVLLKRLEGALGTMIWVYIYAFHTS